MLSLSAQKVIHDYLNLPFPGQSGVRCPYFNNARARQRAQLRVLVGKGLPQEIVEEAQIISFQYHAGLFDKTGHYSSSNAASDQTTAAQNIRKFLVDNNLGIECSGFVTQVLKTHYLETAEIDLTKKLFITSPKNFLRWLIARFRPIENIGVKTYADNRNTISLAGADGGYDYQKIAAGDLIVILETGPQKKHNHIILITGNDGQTLTYVHARAWTSEGKYGHGVTIGIIKITHPDQNLLAQEWAEKNQTGLENETYLEAKNAAVLEIRRIKIS